MIIVLLGNYPPDRQRSMAAFGSFLQDALTRRGIQSELILPSVKWGTSPEGYPSGLKKWLGYLDKFVIFPGYLRKLKKQGGFESRVFHILDHSNAMYEKALRGLPLVLTCHDLLAVRGGLGEADSYCPASRTGVVLQRWILRALRKIPAVACASETTRADFERLTSPRRPESIVRTIFHAANAPFLPLPKQAAAKHLPPRLQSPETPFLLMVGSSLPRKNRETAIKCMAGLAHRWKGLLVIAGEKLTPEQKSLAAATGVEKQIIEIESPPHEQLVALYSAAHALLFPSLSEGFGWPITEAQACDCPVICGDLSAVPEVAGDAALICPALEPSAFAEAVLRLDAEPALRTDLISKGRRNLARFTEEQLVDSYVELYMEVLKSKK